MLLTASVRVRLANYKTHWTNCLHLRSKQEMYVLSASKSERMLNCVSRHPTLRRRPVS